MGVSVNDVCVSMSVRFVIACASGCVCVCARVCVCVREREIMWACAHTCVSVIIDYTELS